jgi:hypothetical protein
MAKINGTLVKEEKILTKGEQWMLAARQEAMKEKTKDHTQ